MLQEPVDIAKYSFARTPFKERWGILVNKSCNLSKKNLIKPEDLVNVPVIMPQRELVQNELKNWFGDYADQIESVASGNLLYNQAALARCHMGCIITLELNCTYDDLHFVPFSPKLESGTVLVWKKTQFFSPAATAFIQFSRNYIKNINNTL